MTVAASHIEYFSYYITMLCTVNTYAVCAEAMIAAVS